MQWYMNEERVMLQNAIREFAQTRVRPHVDKMEKEEADAKELILEMGKLGFFALGKDEKYGGVGVDWIDVMILMEELAKESHTVGILALIQNILINEIMRGGTEEQIQKYAIPAMNGEILLGMACNEPTGAFFFDGYSTRAVKDGDDWVINGNKCLITQVDTADVFLVAALTADHVNMATGEGYATFIVPADDKGISIGHIEHKVGWHGSHTGTMYFENIRVSDDARIPTLSLAPSDGLGGMYGALDLGGAEKCLEKAIEILKGRVQDGGLSLWDAHEVIRNNCAELTVKISAFKNAIFGHAMNMNVGGHTFTDDFALKIEGAKLLEYVAGECMILAGGAGMVYETGIERYYRDVKLTEVGCGSNKTELGVIALTL